MSFRCLNSMGEVLQSLKKAVGGIAVRLSASLVVLILTTAVAVSTLVLRDGRLSLEADLRVRALQLAEIMANQMVEPLLYEEHYSIYALLRTYLNSKDSIIVYAEVYDEQGSLLLEEDKGEFPRPLGMELKSFSELPFFLELQSGEDHTFDLIFPVRTKKLGDIGYLRLGITSRHLLMTLADARQKVYSLSALIAFCGVIAGLWMARSLLRPVLTLNQAVSRLGHGELGTEIAAEGVGEIRELTLGFNDMSRQLKNSMDEVQAAQKRLVQSEKLYALGQFSAGLAHEIKNPLTSIKMLIQRAQSYEEPLDGADLEVVAGEIRRIDSIVSRFLSCTQPSSFHFEKSDLNALVQDVLAITRVKIEKSSVQLNLDLDSNLPALPVYLDGVKQVLLNLVLNALQAMPSGGVLMVSTVAEEDACNISVQDSGVGIPPEDFSRLFDPFFTSKAEGTGLGLAVAWNIVEQHGGQVDIDSTPGLGTKVTVFLPYEQTSDS